MGLILIFEKYSVCMRACVYILEYLYILLSEHAELLVQYCAN